MKRVFDTGIRSLDWDRNDNRNPQPAIRREQGQAVTLFAVLIPVAVLFALGVVDYMITNTRVMETVAAADLAAHAGAQRITIRPDGTVESLPAQAQAVASSYFAAQALTEANLESVSCGLVRNRPACQVSAQVRSSGWLLPKQWISVHAVGYLVYGVTKGDQ
jgi:Flp pilus assembly protein TadG